LARLSRLSTAWLRGETWQRVPSRQRRATAYPDARN